ncbi:MAG: hypothetical protein ABL918_11465 [Chakrabartia sp.]
MLILRLFAIWILERVIEVALGAYLLLRIFGTNASYQYSGNTGDLYVNMIYLSLFYIASGFIFSTLYFGLFKRFYSIVTQCFVMGCAFLAHLGLFLLLGRINPNKLLVLAFFGASIVVLSSIVGSSVLKLWALRRNGRGSV